MGQVTRLYRMHSVQAIEHLEKSESKVKYLGDSGSFAISGFMIDILLDHSYRAAPLLKHPLEVSS